MRDTRFADWSTRLFSFSCFLPGRWLGKMVLLMVVLVEVLVDLDPWRLLLQRICLGSR